MMSFALRLPIQARSHDSLGNLGFIGRGGGNNKGSRGEYFPFSQTPMYINKGWPSNVDKPYYVQATSMENFLQRMLQMLTTVARLGTRPSNFHVFQNVRYFGLSTVRYDRQSKEVELCESDLEEKFVKGFGKGGQKVNKTSNCVETKAFAQLGLQLRWIHTLALVSW